MISPSLLTTGELFLKDFIKDFPYEIGFILTGVPENLESKEAVDQPKSAIAISTFFFLLENYSKTLALDFLVAVSKNSFIIYQKSKFN